MTLLEALQANPVFSQMSQKELTPFFLERGVDCASAFSQDRLRELELVSADIYAKMSLLPDFSEGSLSVSYDRDKLSDKAQGIYKKYNDRAFLSESLTLKTQALELW